ncbi:MAG: NAD(+)/NADH kinase [Oscillospiraceae bacterium]|nr:NAD(+)/NADH kinase [Oscillospiraceae bacterium]MBR0452237.1 NAD(+)/NADH kinase [Oscillospiraceae bacterium]
MKLFICPNGYTEEQNIQARQCVCILEQKCGHSCSMGKEDSICVFGDETKACFGPDESELVISLGGDGSVLRAAKTALANEKPLMGINSGRLGYLCAISFSDLERFNELFDELFLSQRHLLEVTSGEKKYIAVNDIVFAKRNVGSTVDLIISVDDERELKMRGDGIIFSTATGSTAYNLSAGGPMLSPDLDAFVMTPICPHSRQEYPVVLSENHTVFVSEKYKEADIYVDGVFVDSLNEKATVKKADKTLQLYTDKRILKAF